MTYDIGQLSITGQLGIFAGHLMNTGVIADWPCGQHRLSSDLTHDQADLSLRWAHDNMPHCWLSQGVAHLYVAKIYLIQSNFNGSNTFGTMKTSSRQG